MPKPQVPTTEHDRPAPADPGLLLESVRRPALTELHDLPWWPASLRAFLTNLLILNWSFPWVAFRRGGERLFPSFTSLTARVLRRVVDGSRSSCQSMAASRNVVDLCSGSGGPWKELYPLLADHIDHVWLTDLRPPPRPPENMQDEHNPIEYFAEPVDATDLPEKLQGMRTLFGCLHHFSPSLAAAILRSAVERQEPVIVVETCNRSLIQMIGAVLLMVPLALLVPVVFYRQTPWHLFLLTYLIPVTPLLCAFDGAVSCMRAYRPTEMLALAHSADGQEVFQWKAGKESFFGLFSLNYLVGVPKRNP